jgi:AP-4 complex subunit epsilon-1
MLGHDASFAHIHAVNLTQSKNLLVKRIGYLAASLFIDENSELLILMICTIQRDL